MESTYEQLKVAKAYLTDRLSAAQTRMGGTAGGGTGDGLSPNGTGDCMGGLSDGRGGAPHNSPRTDALFVEAGLQVDFRAAASTSASGLAAGISSGSACGGACGGEDTLGGFDVASHLGLSAAALSTLIVAAPPPHASSSGGYGFEGLRRLVVSSDMDAPGSPLERYAEQPTWAAAVAAAITAGGPTQDIWLRYELEAAHGRIHELETRLELREKELVDKGQQLATLRSTARAGDAAQVSSLAIAAELQERLAAKEQQLQLLRSHADGVSKELESRQSTLEQLELRLRQAERAFLQSSSPTGSISQVAPPADSAASSVAYIGGFGEVIGAAVATNAGPGHPGDVTSLMLPPSVHRRYVGRSGAFQEGYGQVEGSVRSRFSSTASVRTRSPASPATTPPRVSLQVPAGMPAARLPQPRTTLTLEEALALQADVSGGGYVRAADAVLARRTQGDGVNFATPEGTSPLVQRGIATSYLFASGVGLSYGAFEGAASGDAIDLGASCTTAFPSPHLFARSLADPETEAAFSSTRLAGGCASAEDAGAGQPCGSSFASFFMAKGVATSSYRPSLDSIVTQIVGDKTRAVSGLEQKLAELENMIGQATTRNSPTTSLSRSQTTQQSYVTYGGSASIAAATASSANSAASSLAASAAAARSNGMSPGRRSAPVVSVSPPMLVTLGTTTAACNDRGPMLRPMSPLSRRLSVGSPGRGVSTPGPAPPLSTSSLPPQHRVLMPPSSLAMSGPLRVTTPPGGVGPVLANASPAAAASAAWPVRPVSELWTAGAMTPSGVPPVGLLGGAVAPSAVSSCSYSPSRGARSASCQPLSRSPSPCPASGRNAAIFGHAPHVPLHSLPPSWMRR